MFIYEVIHLLFKLIQLNLINYSINKILYNYMEHYEILLLEESKNYNLHL